jgi:hypothetical protein
MGLHHDPLYTILRVIGFAFAFGDTPYFRVARPSGVRAGDT